jgi:hypothetical protein
MPRAPSPIRARDLFAAVLAAGVAIVLLAGVRACELTSADFLWV